MASSSNSKFLPTIKGLNIVTIVISAFTFISGLFLLGLSFVFSSAITSLGGLDQFVSSAISDSGDAASQLNNSVAQLSNTMGTSYTTHDFAAYIVSLGFIIFVVFAALLFLISAARIVFSIIILAWAPKGKNLKSCFVLSIVSACISVLCFNNVCLVLGIISAVMLHKQRKLLGK